MTIGGTGDIGNDSKILTSYFERNDAAPCPSGANPAEWMLEAIGAAPSTFSEIDWHQTWCSSPEYQLVQHDLAQLRAKGTGCPHLDRKHDSASYDEFAAPLWQ